MGSTSRGRALPIFLAMLMSAASAGEIESAVELDCLHFRPPAQHGGGSAVGSAYLDNVDLTLSIDGERVFGTPGLTFFVYALYNNSARFSARYSGDAMVVSNIDAPRAARLYEAWLDYTFDPRRQGSLRFGLYDLNTEFDTSDSRALFVNSSFGVGHELGQSGLNGPSIFPVTSLALRFAVKPHDDWLLLTAVLDGVPGDPDDPTATTVRLDPDDRALLIAEVQRTLPRGAKLAAGTWRYTKDGPRIDDELLGGVPPRTTGRLGVYGNADFEIWRNSAIPHQTVRLFARAGYASDAAHEYGSNVQVGLTFQQPWARDDEESLGVAMSHSRATPPTATRARHSDRHCVPGKLATEMTYRRALASWLTLQPTLQYIRHPSAEPLLRDAFVVGLRFELEIESP